MFTYSIVLLNFNFNVILLLPEAEQNVHREHSYFAIIQLQVCDYNANVEKLVRKPKPLWSRWYSFIDFKNHISLD